MYLNVSGGYTHMRLNKIYILSHVQHMLQTLRPVDLILGMAGLPTGTEFPYFVRNLHAKYGSTNLAYKIRKLSSVSSVT